MIYTCFSIGIILTSLRFWENFVSSNFNFTEKFKIRAHDLHNNLDNGRFQTSLFHSLLKSIVLVGMAFVVFMVMEHNSYVSEHVNGRASEPLVDYSAEKFDRIFGLLSHPGRSKTRLVISQFFNIVMCIDLFVGVVLAFCLQLCIVPVSIPYSMLPVGYAFGCY